MAGRYATKLDAVARSGTVTPAAAPAPIDRRSGLSFRDFFVEYVTGDGRARRFSRRKGRTHYKSDARLAERPHVLQRCCAYRALPLEDDERDLVHTS